MANKEKSIACTFCQKRYRITIAMQSKNGKRMRCSRCEKVFRVQIPVVYLERQEAAAELKQVENSLGLLRKITINSLGAVTTTFLVAYLYQYASIMGGLIIGIVGAIAIHAIMRYAYNYCSNADKKKAVCKLCNRSLYHIIHMWWIDLLMFILKAGIAIAVLQFLAFLMFFNSSYYADVITGVVCIAIIWCIYVSVHLQKKTWQRYL